MASLADTAPTVTIRRALPDDAAALAEFAERTFRDTFERFNRPENMSAYVAGAFGPERQSAEIANPRAIVLLMESDTGLMGYAQLLRDAAPPETMLDSAVELQRFYVADKWHGLGFAQRLMRATLEVAAGARHETIWLAVWEHNPRAIQFYARQGFVDAGSQLFILGDDRQTDRIMLRSTRV